MVAAAEAASAQPVVGHLEQSNGMQQRQATPPQLKGTEPAAAQPPNSPVASDGLGQLFRRQQR